MPTPYIFSSESALVDALRRKQTTVKAQSFFAERVETISDVVHLAVASNTFRAFRNLPVRPSVTFRDWTENYVQRFMPPLNSKLGQREYSAYVHHATLALCKYWRNVTGTEMGYGRGAKLLNLVLKKLACLQSLTDGERQGLIWLQHIPLDSYTIVGLFAVAPDLAIPRNATMKYVETQRQYNAFQERIALIAAKARVPPIYYDILAWDIGHDG